MGSGKVETIAIVSDVHFPAHDEAAWGAFRAWHKHTKPHHTVILGDAVDFAQLSKYPQGAKTESRVLPEIKIFVREANALRKECGRMTFCEGNHDDRWNKHILEPIAKHIDGLLGLTFREQCYFQGLDKTIAWHKSTASEPGITIGNMILRHGDKVTPRFGATSPARNALIRSAYRSQVIGHTHRIEMVAVGTHRGTEIAVANGHFQKLASAEYCHEPNWVHGFTVLEHDVDAGFVHPYPVVIRNGRFAWRGRVFGVNR